MSEHSTRRRRWIRPGTDAQAWCSGGRWGPRRVRTNECLAILRAEDWYTAILRDSPGRLGPGSRGTGTARLGKRDHTAEWETRPNAVWRRGRIFLVCPRCATRCTRLYMPSENAWLACRRCWGLTYASRTLQNYKSTQWGRGRFAALFETTHRDYALMTTGDRRKERRAASVERWRQRRRWLRDAARKISTARDRPNAPGRSR